MWYKSLCVNFSDYLTCKLEFCLINFTFAEIFIVGDFTVQRHLWYHQLSLTSLDLDCYPQSPRATDSVLDTYF